MSSSIRNIVINSESDWSLCLENSAASIGVPLEDTSWERIRLGFLVSINSSSHSSLGAGATLALGLGYNMNESVYGADTITNFIGMVSNPSDVIWSAFYHHYQFPSLNGKLTKVVNSSETVGSTILSQWYMGVTTSPPDASDLRTGIFMDIQRLAGNYTFRVITQTSNTSVDISTDQEFVDLMEASYHGCSKTDYTYYTAGSTTFDDTTFPMNSLYMSWNKPETLAIGRVAYSILK